MGIRSSIFPLYKFKGINKVTDADFLGTCFFMKIGRWDVMLTARHNLDWKFPEEDRFLIAERIGEKTNFVNIKGVFTRHLKEDIAFVLVSSESLAGFTEPVSPLTLLDSHLQLGEDVFSLGYPLTYKKLDENTREITFHVNHIFLRGYVHSIVRGDFLSDQPHEFFKTNYSLSFSALEGLSGAPLLVGKEGKVFVAGLIYNNWIVNYRTTSSEEIRSKEKTEIVTKTTQYEFGLASTYEPILRIRELLEEYEKSKRGTA